LLALELPEVLGVGYEATHLALRNSYDLQLAILLALARATATALCLGSGFGGGMFSPSLVLGAMVGSAYGIVAHSALPELGSAASVYALAGMGAVAACTLGAPISTVIMIFELTADYGVTFAVMIAVAVASVFCRQLHWHSYFTWQLARRGLDLQTRRDRQLLRATRLVEVMRREGVTVAQDADLERLSRCSATATCRSSWSTRAAGCKARSPSRTSPMRSSTPSSSRRSSRTISSTASPRRCCPTTISRPRCACARPNREEHLPVVDLKVIGEVRYQDLVLAYNRALLAARAAERGES
jgi:CIC family chloride channel protein